MAHAGHQHIAHVVRAYLVAHRRVQPVRVQVRHSDVAVAVYDVHGQAAQVISAMFTGFSFTSQSMVELMRQLTPSFLIALACGLVFSQPVRTSVQKATEGHAFERSLNVLSYVGAFVLLALCLLQLAGGGYNPFIYFRF